MTGGQLMRCPGCGEDVLHEPPAGPAWWEPPGLPVPAWSHRDGTTLCPVMGASGDAEPARPEPGRLSRNAGMHEREREAPRAGGTSWVTGRRYVTEMAGQPGRQAHPRAERELEAGS